MRDAAATFFEILIVWSICQCIIQSLITFTLETRVELKKKFQEWNKFDFKSNTYKRKPGQGWYYHPHMTEAKFEKKSQFKNLEVRFKLGKVKLQITLTKLKDEASLGVCSPCNPYNLLLIKNCSNFCSIRFPSKQYLYKIRDLMEQALEY